MTVTEMSVLCGWSLIILPTVQRDAPLLGVYNLSKCGRTEEVIWQNHIRGQKQNWSHNGKCIQ